MAFQIKHYLFFIFILFASAVLISCGNESDKPAPEEGTTKKKSTGYFERVIGAPDKARELIVKNAEQTYQTFKATGDKEFLDAAKEMLNELIDEHPKSPSAEKAKKLLEKWE